MKKFILSALLPLVYFLYFLFPCFPVPTAQAVADSARTSAPATGGYACILTDAYFYATPNEQRGLFLLPQTYFVKILEPASDFCKIEYLYDDIHVKRLVGYAKTNELTPVDFIPERPYLYCLFEISYALDGANDSDDGVLDKITFTCGYYGDYKIGPTTYCYVLRGEEFGYVPKPTDLTFEKNGEYAEHLQTQTETDKADSPPSNNESSTPAQIAILVAICLLVPILAALILKPPRRPPYETEE